MSQIDVILPEHVKFSLDEADTDTNGEINMERVPFVKNTIGMDPQQIDRSLRAMSAENKENFKRDCYENQSHRSCTPSHEVELPLQPLTPTANLKVLFNAVSPEIRNRDEQKQPILEKDFSSNSQDNQFEAVKEVFDSQELDTKFGPSRKDKSLGLLCQKFLQKYPEYPGADQKVEICLDEVAKELQVERRRIYDIVNVLESVEIVSRVAKNRYAWHGKNNLQTTLAKLKVLGDSEGFGEQIQKLKDFEFNRELEEQFGRADPRNSNGAPLNLSITGESCLFNKVALRKDKSLGIMSQKFLMLFLVSKPKTVNLDLSAKLLIGDANIDRTENARFKTKIRRLYDIANILTSLNLICKVHVTEIRGRKPAFKYIGPEIEEASEIQIACCSDGCHRPTSRHSMLDCIQNPKGLISQDDSKLRFSNHSSFETLCAVATVETNKMNVSLESEPCSPTKSESAEGSSVASRIPTRYIALSQLDGNSIQIGNSNVGGICNKLPTKDSARHKIQNSFDEQKLPQLQYKSKKLGSEAVIFKTVKLVDKQQNVIPLTKEQIDAVLRSLKVPVPVSNGQHVSETSKQTENKNTIVVATQVTEFEKSAEMQELNEKTPVILINTPGKNSKRPALGGDFIPLEKRIKLDFPSPLCSSDDISPSPVNPNAASRFKRKNADSVKPVPQRALHLAPEFADHTTVVEMVPSGDAPQFVPVAAGTKPQQTKKTEYLLGDSSLWQNSSMSKSMTVQSTSLKPTCAVVLSSDPAYDVVQRSGISELTHTVLQLSSEPSTVIQIPFVNFNGQQKSCQPLTLPFLESQNVQILDDPSVQQVLTPTSSGSCGPRVVTYSCLSSQSNFALSNGDLVMPSLKGTNSITTVLHPVATEVIASAHARSPLQGLQLVRQSSPVTFFNKAPGGFVPISNSLSGGTKMLVSSNSISCQIPVSLAGSTVVL